jgi:hypothetical protein
MLNAKKAVKLFVETAQIQKVDPVMDSLRQEHGL